MLRKLVKTAPGAMLVLALLVFAGCRMEDDPLIEPEPEPVTTSDPVTDDEPETIAAENTLDERLYGVWEWKMNTMVEQFIIKPVEGSMGTLTYGSNVYSATIKESFAGTIEYAENFSSGAGIIIIQYLPGHKQNWVDWTKADPSNGYFPLRADNPEGNYYGIYFLNMNDEGTRVFLALTNDQNNNYGPTETGTLAAAKAKFTQGNMNQLLDLSVGDPQDKVQDL
ncbi:MAG: hypothetical protein LBF63_05215 [Treponema sp.]|jgi:hypothetical protein|nr:hypothetical protein [Treponema sp.]